MTSWKKRIDNVSRVVYSILKNSVKPDKIICNLSTDEFVNKENDLPDSLLLLQEATCFEINWVKENTTVFKKFIPTIQKYYGEENYYLFTIDDDVIYDYNYIKTGIEALKNHNAVVIAKRTETGVWGGMFCCNSSIFKPDYWEHITPELISLRMNDPYTNRYLQKYGIRIFNVCKNMTINFNEIQPNRNTVGGYKKRNKLVNRVIDKIFKSY